MNHPTNQNGDALFAQDKMSAAISKAVSAFDGLKFTGLFEFICTAPVEERRQEYVNIRKALLRSEEDARNIAVKRNILTKRNFLFKAINYFKIKYLNNALQVANDYSQFLYDELMKIPTYVKWQVKEENLITTIGMNTMLDNHFSASGYTAAWYMGLIDNSGFSAVAAANTMSSHAGWTESTAYDNATRIAAAWSAASGGSKSLSAALGFLINATVTLNGGFLTTVSTKGGTTGILGNATSFTGGNRAAVDGDTVNVSYTATLAQP